MEPAGHGQMVKSGTPGSWEEPRGEQVAESSPRGPECQAKGRGHRLGFRGEKSPDLTDAACSVFAKILHI